MIRLHLPFALLRRRDTQAARFHAAPALYQSRAAGNSESLALAAIVAAGVAILGRDASSAARLLGASCQLLERIGVGITLADQRDIDHFRDLTAQALPPAEWLALLAEGQSLTEDDVVALALRMLADE